MGSRESFSPGLKRIISELRWINKNYAIVMAEIAARKLLSARSVPIFLSRNSFAERNTHPRSRLPRATPRCVETSLCNCVLELCGLITNLQRPLRGRVNFNCTLKSIASLPPAHARRLSAGRVFRGKNVILFLQVNRASLGHRAAGHCLFNQTCPGPECL